MGVPQQLSALARSGFLEQGLTLPVEWKGPGKQYHNAFEEADREVSPNTSGTLFNEASLNRLHVESARRIGAQFERYLDGIASAIGAALQQWTARACVSGVVINGPSGAIQPGCVNGPALTPLIIAAAPCATAQETKYSVAIARALGEQWRQWQAGLTGTLMYPALAAVPGPVAPPTPNVPLPLLALGSAGEAGLDPAVLQQHMASHLNDPGALHAQALFEAIAGAFDQVFQNLKATTLVVDVMGTGPVPSFAPPAVPAGPVVGGTGSGAPGCLS